MVRLAETDLDMNCPEGSAPLLVGGDSAGGGTAVSLILVLKQGAGWTPQGGRSRARDSSSCNLTSVENHDSCSWYSNGTTCFYWGRLHESYGLILQNMYVCFFDSWHLAGFFMPQPFG